VVSFAEASWGVLEKTHESQGIGQENVQELQDHPAQWRRAGDLHRLAP
jgi:hypothetical protein